MFVNSSKDCYALPWFRRWWRQKPTIDTEDSCHIFRMCSVFKSTTTLSLNYNKRTFLVDYLLSMHLISVSFEIRSSVKQHRVQNLLLIFKSSFVHSE